MIAFLWKVLTYPLVGKDNILSFSAYGVLVLAFVYFFSIRPEIHRHRLAFNYAPSSVDSITLGPLNSNGLRSPRSNLIDEPLCIKDGETIEAISDAMRNSAYVSYSNAQLPRYTSLADMVIDHGGTRNQFLVYISRDSCIIRYRNVSYIADRLRPILEDVVFEQ